ncbi:hypothetical protein BGZ88_011561, partial [Linnemannia elongata]
NIMELLCGYFKLQNMKSGKWLAHTHDGGDRIVAFNDADYEDQYWKVVPHGDDKHFKLENKKSGKWIAHTHDGGDRIVPYEGVTYPDQYWSATYHKDL